MTEIDAGASATSPFGRILWPERILVTELERKLAITRVEHARSVGELDVQQARLRLERLDAAATRAELCAALEGRPDPLTPPGLRIAPRVGAALWLALSLVDTIIWVSIGLISGQWDSAWLLWPLIGGGVLVLGLWSTREWDRRMRLSVLDRDP